MWPWRRSDPTWDPNAPPKAGDVIAGKYRVERVLGVGGMGVVVAARHTKLDDVVALKLLRAHVARSRDDVRRFLREGKAASKLKSDHVVRILDLGELPGEIPFLVMEHLEGRDFAAILRDHASMGAELAIGHVIDSALEACEAVAEAHALGIVHRDLKPANIFLARASGGSTRVKVLDFGISKLTAQVDAEDLSLTQTRTLMGSPIYMAPEVLRSARVADARSDVWAFGCILYELLTGTTPFHGETLTELTAQILEEKPRAPSRLRDEVPPELDAVVLRCLEKNPADRFADAAVLAHALAPLAGPSGAIAIDRLQKVVRAAELRARQSPQIETASVPSGILAVETGDATLPGWGTTRGIAGARTRRAFVVATALAALLLIGAFGFFALRGGEPARSAAAGQPALSQLPLIAPSASTTPPPAPSVAPSGYTNGASKPSASGPAAKKVVGKPSAKTTKPQGPNPIFDDPN